MFTGDEYDSSLLDKYKGVKIKTVPTINGKGARDINRVNQEKLR